MLQMNHDIVFQTGAKKYRLALLSSVEIISSVENLVDTATIILPESVLNKPLNLESKIEISTSVTIKFGYGTNLPTEFVGFVVDVINRNGTLQISCEDALFLFRKSVNDKVFKQASVSQILNYLITELKVPYKVICDFDISYEKFTIHQADAYDVLKKLQQDTMANIYFNTEKQELHFHPKFKEKAGNVVYSMQRNIEKSTLEYIPKDSLKYEVIVESTGKDGKIKEVKAGTTGGSSTKLKVSSMSEADMLKIAENLIINFRTARYEGTFDSWLIPFVRPTYTGKIMDSDYPMKEGQYYITTVKTNFSDQGGVRTITPGIKLG